MKKKILALCLVVVLAVTAVTGATLAYFTDKDADANVMVLGNLKIVQNETERDGTAYEDKQDLFPAVLPNDKLEKDGTMTDTDGKTELKIWDASINNEIDKFVSVSNRGTEEAYVRTILAFETVRSYEPNTSDNWTDLHDHFFLINGDYDYVKGDGSNKNTAYDWMYVTIGGKEYVVAVKTYADPLAAGDTTPASLRQFALTWDAGNEVYDFFGEEYDILAVSQAVQTTGFTSAEEALNKAFGEITVENVEKWFAETGVKTSGVNNQIGGFLDADVNPTPAVPNAPGANTPEPMPIA